MGGLNKQLHKREKVPFIGTLQTFINIIKETFNKVINRVRHSFTAF